MSISVWVMEELLSSIYVCAHTNEATTISYQQNITFPHLFHIYNLYYPHLAPHTHANYVFISFETSLSNRGSPIGYFFLLSAFFYLLSLSPNNGESGCYRLMIYFNCNKHKLWHTPTAKKQKKQEYVACNKASVYKWEVTYCTTGATKLRYIGPKSSISGIWFLRCAILIFIREQN